MAVSATLISIDPQPDGRLCKNGHLVAGDNEARVRHTSGRYYKACKTCRRDAVRRVKARQRGETVALLAPAPKPVRQPVFATVEVWTALPADLRTRVAAIILDPEPADALTAAVIRRAAKKRVWVGLGVSFSLIAFVEGLVEESRAARSTRLRLDYLLRAALG